MGIEKDENAEGEQQQELTDIIESLELDPEYFVEKVVEEDSVFKEISDAQKTLQTEAKWFLEKDEWQKVLQNIKAFKVIKMPRILQSLFFINRIERSQICEPGSNKMNWKKAKELLETELPTRMLDYKAYGQNTNEYLPYQRINYVEQIIKTDDEGKEITQELVDEYHAGFGKLYKWLRMAIDNRKKDIVRRKAI